MADHVDDDLIESVRNGVIGWSDVSAEVRAAVNARISADIQERLRTTNWAEELHREGHAVIGLNASGDTVQYFADGSSVVLRSVRTSDG